MVFLFAGRFEVVLSVEIKTQRDHSPPFFYLFDIGNEKVGMLVYLRNRRLDDPAEKIPKQLVLVG